MDESPALEVDWECGEGRLHLGSRLLEAPARLRHDVLSDWKDQVEQLLRETEHSLYPDRRSELLRRQRVENARRRTLCARLSGQTIRLVEPLVNGDLLLHLGNGRTLVLYAAHEDVKVDVVGDPAHARAHAQRDNTGDYYVREEQ